MAKVILFAAVSLDGYVAFGDDTVGPLFDQVAMNLVPVALGAGRPFFGRGSPAGPLMLENQVRGLLTSGSIRGWLRDRH